MPDSNPYHIPLPYLRARSTSHTVLVQLATKGASVVSSESSEAGTTKGAMDNVEGEMSSNLSKARLYDVVSGRTCDRIMQLLPDKQAVLKYHEKLCVLGRSQGIEAEVANVIHISLGA